MSAVEASRSRWATHEAVNQPRPLADYDPFPAAVDGPAIVERVLAL